MLLLDTSIFLTFFSIFGLQLAELFATFATIFLKNEQFLCDIELHVLICKK